MAMNKENDGIKRGNDLISRQEAVDAFDGVKVDEEYCTEYDIGYNDGIDFAVSKISVLPSAELHWIPVSERLPEKDGRYLVTCSKIGAWEVDWNIWYCKPAPSWLWEQGVIAWMPLPEAYEGGGK